MDKLVTSCFHAGKIKNDVNIPELIQSLITDYKMTGLIVISAYHLSPLGALSTQPRRSRTWLVFLPEYGGKP